MELLIESNAADVVHVQARGRIREDSESPAVEPLGELLGPAGYGRRVLLDLEQVTMLNSSGVSWLLVVHKRCREAGGRLVLHSIPPLVAGVLKVLRMNLVLEMADDRAAAARLAAGAGL